MDLAPYSSLVTMVFQAASTIAIIGAAIKYFQSRDERSGETLLELEERFRTLRERWSPEPFGKLLSSIPRVVDPESQEFGGSTLERAINKGLADRSADRDDLERAWMARLDDFIRFLLIVAAMERNRLLKRGALWDTYHYWFRAVARNPTLRRYVGRYYPVLHGFLRENERRMLDYEELQRREREFVNRSVAPGAGPAPS